MKNQHRLGITKAEAAKLQETEGEIEGELDEIKRKEAAVRCRAEALEKHKAELRQNQRVEELKLVKKHLNVLLPFTNHCYAPTRGCNDEKHEFTGNEHDQPPCPRCVLIATKNGHDVDFWLDGFDFELRIVEAPR